LIATKGLAHTAFRVIDDDAFFDEIRKEFETMRKGGWKHGKNLTAG